MPVYSSHLLRFEELQLGQRVRQERKRLGWTLKDLSLKVNISSARLSEIETGRHPLDFHQALAITDALGINPESFFPVDVTLPYQIARHAEVQSEPPRHVSLVGEHDACTNHNQFLPLAALFVGRHLEPVLGRIMPTADLRLHYCYHHTEEFVFVLKGTIEFRMKSPDGDCCEQLRRGDCIYFRSDVPHLLRSLDRDPAESIHVFCTAPARIDTGIDWLAHSPVAYIEYERDNGFTHHLGERLKALREMHGWSTRQVAEVIEVTERQLIRIENGDRAVSFAAILSLARAFGKPLRELVGQAHTGGPYYFVQRSADIPSIPSRTRRTPVERPNVPRSKTCQPLASGFATRNMYPYFIRLLNVDVETLTLHEHHGQEFIYVLENELELTTYAEGKEVHETLGPGDSCYIDSSVPHLLRGRTRNPYSPTTAEVLDVFCCPLGEGYLFGD